jgi:pyridoxamine 5'-phosphate oxidase family protein
MEDVFTEEESLYLEAQDLCRLATVGRDGLPHVLPCGFDLNRELQTIDCRGWKLAETVKWKHVLRTGMAAVVVDDVVPPYLPRFLEVRGRAEPVEADGEALIRIWPRLVVVRGFAGSTTVQRRRIPERGRVPS